VHIDYVYCQLLCSIKSPVREIPLIVFVNYVYFLYIGICIQIFPQHTLKPGDESTSAYERMLESLVSARERCNMKYLYTLYTDGSQVYYGVDADDSEKRAAVGDLYEASYAELAPAFNGEVLAQEYIDYSEDGELITVYAPIIDNTGKIIGILGCDYDAASIADSLSAGLIQMILIGVIVIVGLIIIIKLPFRNCVADKKYL